MLASIRPRERPVVRLPSWTDDLHRRGYPKRVHVSVWFLGGVYWARWIDRLLDMQARNANAIRSDAR